LDTGVLQRVMQFDECICRSYINARNGLGCDHDTVNVSR